jgi:hypothetical protein
MPASWDYYPNINYGSTHVEWPTGRMTLSPGVVPRWVEAWIVQSSTSDPSEISGAGASQSTSQRANWQPGNNRWFADGIPPGWTNGSFQRRLALGISLRAIAPQGGL